jgi:hypothetical protein
MSASRTSVAAMGKQLLVRQMSAVDDSMKSGVSAPTGMRRTSHATLEGAALAGSVALPSDFELYFGAPLRQQPRVALPGYDDRVPAVLVALAADMVQRKGLAHEGIFRLSAEMGTLKAAKDALNRGDGLLANLDPTVTSALIKDFFRSLPESLLLGVAASELALYGNPKTGASDEAWQRLLFTDAVIPEPNRSTFLWMLDVMSAVCANVAMNKMTPRALAIVFAPSLYFTKDADMSAMARTQDVTQMIEAALGFLIRVPGQARKPLG